MVSYIRKSKSKTVIISLFIPILKYVRNKVSNRNSIILIFLKLNNVMIWLILLKINKVKKVLINNIDKLLFNNLRNKEWKYIRGKFIFVENEKKIRTKIS